MTADPNLQLTELGECIDMTLTLQLHLQMNQTRAPNEHRRMAAHLQQIFLLQFCTVQKCKEVHHFYLLMVIKPFKFTHWGSRYAAVVWFSVNSKGSI